MAAAAEWLPDPTGRHEYRYFDGESWTDDVADRGVQTTDAFARPELQAQLNDQLQKLTKWTDKQMKGAASWVNRRGRKPSPDPLRVLDTEPSSSVLGQWNGLATAVTKYGIATSGLAGGDQLLGVLKAVTGSEDAQGRLLRSIDAKVDALVKGPYNTGRTHLREAQRLGIDDPNQRGHIEAAKDCFYQAHGQAASVQSRSLVEYHLGVTWLLLGRPSDSIYWLEQSHGSAMAVVNELAAQTENVKVLRSKGGTAAAAWMYPAGLVILGMKFKKVVAAERAREMLVDFLPFVACAARSRNGLAPDLDGLPALELVNVTEDTYELIAVPAASG
jgi:hypothetical protein